MKGACNEVIRNMKLNLEKSCTNLCVCLCFIFICSYELKLCGELVFSAAFSFMIDLTVVNNPGNHFHFRPIVG